MENGRFILDNRVLPALGVLTAAERAAIHVRLAELADLHPAKWPARGAIRLSPDEPLYLVRVDDSLRVIARAAEGERPEIVDVVRHETLEWFRAAAGACS